MPELESLGHSAVAMDLPSHDPAATFETYADVVAEHLDGAEAADTVLVGHSLAGLTIPLVPSRRPVGRLVYLCSLVPVPGVSFVEQLRGHEPMLDPAYVEGLGEADAEGRRAWVDAGLARHFLYGDCSDEDAAAAIARLRPQGTTPYTRPCSLTGFPDVPSTYVVCGEDRLVRPDWSRAVARERLQADLVELPGSHSPFLSRPAALASVLHDLVR